MNRPQANTKDHGPAAASALDRRDFLTASAGAVLLACKRDEGKPAQKPAPRARAGAECDCPPSSGARLSDPAKAGAGVAPFPLGDASVAELRARMVAGQLTAEKLVEELFSRTEALDKAGPALRALTTRNPDALALARKLDQERRAGRVRGPLHGIPVILKDNIDTADKMPTTAGAHALAASLAPRDAYLVERLRAAGAVILAKANLSEWANFRSARSTSGWSAVGGQTRNPYALFRNPCGSSAGTAVAVAAGYAPFGVGTETDGSIVCPAQTCGLVGFKPTVGLISRAGIIPISHSQDTAGPLARSVADAAELLNVLAAGPEPRDLATHAISSSARGRDYTRALEPGALRGVRIGVARKFFGFSAAVDARMESALTALGRAGAVLVDNAELATHGQLFGPEEVVLLHEFKVGLNAYLKTLNANVPVRTLAELIAYNQRHAAIELKDFGQELFIKAEATKGLAAPEYVKALDACRRLSRSAGIDATLAKHNVECLVAPSGGPAWLTDPLNGDHFAGGSSTPAAVAGYPSVTVPLAPISGLPVGISFFSTAHRDERLLALAFAFERATQWRRAPGFSA